MRARNIKPGFYKNSDLADCSIHARYLAPGLWMLADRDGRLEDRPKQIKGEIFPYDNVDVNLLLEELAHAKHITRYEIGEQRFIQIEKFTDHQRPHTNEAESRIPSPKQSRKTPKKLSTKERITCDQDDNHFALNDDTLTTDSHIPIPEPLPNGNSAREKKISLESLSIDHNREWLAEKRSQGRYLLHDENFILEHFKNYCRSKGKKYANYLAAYRNSFEWESCQPKPIHGGNPTKEDRAKAAVMRAATSGGFAPEEQPASTTEISIAPVSGLSCDEDLREGA